MARDHRYIRARVHELVQVVDGITHSAGVIANQIGDGVGRSALSHLPGQPAAVGGKEHLAPFRIGEHTHLAAGVTRKLHQQHRAVIEKVVRRAEAGQGWAIEGGKEETPPAEIGWEEAGYERSL
jgi:hypothetical protein